MAIEPSEVLVPEPRKNTQLQPSEELRRPDKHGQLPHIIMTTFPDLPLSELQIDDILEINWQGVQTAVRDAVVRVRHEGDLSSATLRETIQLIALALKKLEVDFATLQRRQNDRPRVGLIAWLLSWLPTPTCRKLRAIIREWKSIARKIRSLEETREKVFALRGELAVEVDRRIDGMLLQESTEYRELQATIARDEPVRVAAKDIIKQLSDLDALEESLARNNDGSYASVRAKRQRKENIEAKLPAFVGFCRKHAAESFDGNKGHRGRGDVDVCLRVLLAELESKAAPTERAMAAMRDGRKQELYGQAVLA